MENTGKILSHLRKIRRIRQVEIGVGVGLKNRQISHLETGRRGLSSEMIAHYIQYFQKIQKLSKNEWQKLFIAIFTDIFSSLKKTESLQNLFNFSIQSTIDSVTNLKLSSPGQIISLQMSFYTPEEWSISKRRFIQNSIENFSESKINELFNLLSKNH